VGDARCLAGVACTPLLGYAPVCGGAKDPPPADKPFVEAADFADQTLIT